MVFPWIPFLFGRRKRLSDIEFLSIKEFDGKAVTSEVTRLTADGAGDLATLTASSGKDMYLAKAKINVITNNATALQTVIELKVNGVIKETFDSLLLTTANTTINYEFAITGLKVAATQIIKLELISLGANTQVNSVLECFEETTGESPQIG